MVIKFTYPGEPMAWKRPDRNKKNGQIYTPLQTIEREQHIKALYLQKCGRHFGDQPLHMQITFYLGIPQSDSKKKRKAKEGMPSTKKRDIDNMCKLVLDALNGAAYNDDKQVTDITLKKRWSERPRTEVIIWTY